MLSNYMELIGLYYFLHMDTYGSLYRTAFFHLNNSAQFSENCCSAAKLAQKNRVSPFLKRCILPFFMWLQQSCSPAKLFQQSSYSELHKNRLTIHKKEGKLTSDLHLINVSKLITHIYRWQSISFSLMNEQNVLHYHALRIIRKKVMLTEGFFLCHEFGKTSPYFATHSQKVLQLWLAERKANIAEPATHSCICASAVLIHLQQLPSANSFSWGASGR